MTFQEYIYLKLSTKFKLMDIHPPKIVMDMLSGRVDKDIPESIYEIIWFEGWPIDLKRIDVIKINKEEDGTYFVSYPEMEGVVSGRFFKKHRLIIFSKKEFLKNLNHSSVIMGPSPFKVSLLPIME